MLLKEKVSLENILKTVWTFPAPFCLEAIFTGDRGGLLPGEQVIAARFGQKTRRVMVFVQSLCPINTMSLSVPRRRRGQRQLWMTVRALVVSTTIQFIFGFVCRITHWYNTRKSSTALRRNELVFHHLANNNKRSKYYDTKPHRRTTARVIQSYSPGGANVYPYVTHRSLGPMHEFTSRGYARHANSRLLVRKWSNSVQD